MHISFITTIKICVNYEYLINRINLYILNIQHYCKKYDIEYEILICEHVDNKNICLIENNLVNTNNVTIYSLPQTYPNPYNHNLIESYGKNTCLRNATGEYVCMTSADQLFSENIFTFIKQELTHNIFYRFATFEIPERIIGCNNDIDIDTLIDTCETTKKRLCNPGCFVNNPNIMHIGQKSGDIMLLDRKSFISIGGWPENEFFAHVDTAMCMVASNNFSIIIPPIYICTYTMEQTNRTQAKPSNGIDIENLSMTKCITYTYAKHSNPPTNI